MYKIQWIKMHGETVKFVQSISKATRLSLRDLFPWFPQDFKQKRLWPQKLGHNFLRIFQIPQNIEFTIYSVACLRSELSLW